MNIVKTMSLAAVLAVGAASPAWAALGGDAGSVRAEATSLHGQLSERASAAPEYSVQRLTLASGTVVDEYLSTSGTVFALSWRGMRPPDLSQLLGSYYAEYEAASTTPHARASHMRLDTAHLTYRAGGHQRSLWGNAVVTELMPAGLKVEDLK